MAEGIFIQNQKVCDIAFEDSQGKKLSRIRYDEEWLKNGFSLGPDAPLVPGWQYGWFGFLEDISPDRFGRRMAKEIDPDISRESQYIYCVTPEFRQGAIEFASDQGRHTDFSPLSLSAFAEMLSLWNMGQDIDEPFMRKLVKIAASSGGSRPKINIIDRNDAIWLAKYPATRDDVDVPLWEAVCLDLAGKCGIATPEFRLAETPARHSLLVKRFDRENGKTIPFMSAMTALQASDGESQSYLDLAGRMRELGMGSDLLELYRRMIFNVLVSNRDDHLRNHGFLRIDNSWRLSPAYDLESCPDKAGHCLALDDRGNFAVEPENLVQMAPYYDIPEEAARQMLAMMRDVVSDWEIVAARYGATQADKKIMKHAFGRKKDFPAKSMKKFSLF